jgi:putative transport protein
MSGLIQLHDAHSAAHAIGVLALVCSAGMALGSIEIRGIRLGTAGVLFAGIVAGRVGEPVDHATLDFVKELGLVLFVFTIGLQLGPGFFAALREAGVRLNALAAGVVLLGAGLAVRSAGCSVWIRPASSECWQAPLRTRRPWGRRSRP